MQPNEYFSHQNHGHGNGDERVENGHDRCPRQSLLLGLDHVLVRLYLARSVHAFQYELPIDLLQIGCPSNFGEAIYEKGGEIEVVLPAVFRCGIVAGESVVEVVVPFAERERGDHFTFHGHNALVVRTHAVLVRSTVHQPSDILDRQMEKTNKLNQFASCQSKNACQN